MYPFTRTVPAADVHHGVRVPDPYRWLEDDTSREVSRWVDAQNALTRDHLDGTERDAIRQRLAALHDYPRTGTPIKRRDRFFFQRNTGLQNQDVLFVQDGRVGAPRLLIDPNSLSDDGTISLTGFEPSEDGTRLAYALSRDGSDRQELFVREVETGEDLGDHLRWCKFASVAWLKDGTGFYYTRFPEPGSVPPGDEYYFNRVCFHRLGDHQDADALIAERADDRDIVFTVDVVGDDRYLVITGFKGASDKAEVSLIDLRAASSTPLVLFPGFEHAWSVVAWLGGRLLFQTDHLAERGRIVAVTLPSSLAPMASPPACSGEPALVGASVVEVVPEARDRLETAIAAGGEIVAGYLRRAASCLRRFADDGSPRGEIPLPALGSATLVSNRPEDTVCLFTFESFAWAPTPLVFDFASGEVGRFAPGQANVDPSAYVVDQAQVRSKDGTELSMFVVRARHVTLDGQRPTLLTGYGGFNISLTPTFDPSLFVWLDRGGVYAMANLRGGGEYGEAWHQAGMLERKQQTFDDFIAAAEWLIEHGYANGRTLALEGASNGGLLVAAVMTQRPELAAAVVCRVPVADMLRYHLFTVGRFWIPEYGCADDPAQFATLYAYSPYHHVQDGIEYPATLVMTADTDDRVAPCMARKFAARLQAATAGHAPILLRVERKAGHGAGKPVSKVLDEDADVYRFLFRVLGVT